MDPLFDKSFGTELERFDAAFYFLLAQDESTPPGPTRLARLMGRSGNNLSTLNGRLCARRAELLEKHGFHLCIEKNRWVKS